MVLDIPSVPDSSSDEDAELDELSLDLDQPRRHRGLRTLHISHLLQMVLQDAQTRLFFKAQSVIQPDHPGPAGRRERNARSHRHVKL